MINYNIRNTIIDKVCYLRWKNKITNIHKELISNQKITVYAVSDNILRMASSLGVLQYST